MLDLFKRNSDISDDKIHDKYKILYAQLLERGIISSWTEGFTDRDNKIVNEFQTTFHSSFFEFYLYAYLKSINATVDFKHDRPDFILSQPIEMYIEAVVANIKNGGLSERTRTICDLEEMFLPPWENSKFTTELDEAITRYSNSIGLKAKKYKDEYMKLNWVKKTVPYIVALSSYDQVNYGREFIYAILALLYGFYFDSEEKKYVFKEKITKPNTTSCIDLGIFLKQEYCDISAIIFTSTLTLGKLTSLAKSSGRPIANKVYILRQNCSEDIPIYQLQNVDETCPERLADGIFVFHNPLASNPLDDNVFKDTTQFSYEENSIAINGVLTPLVARLNIFPGTVSEVEIKECVRKYNQKTFDEFYK